MPDSDRPPEANPRALISRGVVRLVREYTGRGPTQAKTVLTDDLAVCLMRDTLTREEHTLVNHGVADDVLSTRKTVQDAMRKDLNDLIETHTGRKVIAFMSDNHIDPDMAVEVFVLEPK